MTDEREKPNAKPQTDTPIADLPARKLASDEEEKTKGGRAGPGTQTEDDIYVG